jgi:FeS assembly protein IscX
MTDDHSSFHRLYWDSSFEIVRTLIDTHPQADLDRVGLDQLFRWIIDLPGFADDPAMANDSILNEILREWYEEVSS